MAAMGDQPSRRIAIHRHEDAGTAWEAVLGQPDPRLRPYIAGTYNGWTERATTVICRREVAKIFVPLIINFGPRFGVLSPGNPSRAMERFDSFVAGLHDCAAITESDLSSHCIQANLTPVGAWRLLGVPMSSLANRVVEIDAILGPAIRRLREQLYDATAWERRFALLDAFFLERMAERPAADRHVLAAMARLEASHGLATIGDVAAEVDLSRRQLIGAFDRQIGLAPKVVARLIRFDRAINRLQGGDRNLAGIALDCGYYDQPHFNREFRQFAGLAPTDFIRSSLGMSDG